MCSCFFFSSRRRHTRCGRDWSSDVCSSDLIAGEGDPDEVVASRGLAVVGDDSELSAVVDEAIEASPDIADKIRAGKVAAVGALVGAVMRKTRGRADATRARELILERLGQVG